ncbi:AsmA-like C-terminal region-containing protein [Haloferula sp.]|uniref:AsmA-like C-terminal region-containing protein n=1 Tax=Haloferula sp. TaxID=2497595 RepID=UPI003C75B414
MSASKIKKWVFRMLTMGVVVVVLVGVAGFVMRDRIISKIISLAEQRLAENGFYIGHDSHLLTWDRGVVLNGFYLYADETRALRVAEFDNVGIRIPLMEIFSQDASVVISSDEGYLKLGTTEGSLQLDGLNFSLTAHRNSLIIGRFEAKLADLEILLGGDFRWEKSEKKRELVIPDLAPLVKASSWLRFSGGDARLEVKLDPPQTADGRVGVSGELTGQDFRWRSLDIDRAKASVVLVEEGIEFPAVELETLGGAVSASLRVNFSSGTVELVKVESRADPFPLVDGILEKELLGKFRSLGGTSVSGENVVFDWREFSKSRGTLSVGSTEGIVIPVDSVELPLREFRGDVNFKDGELDVDGKSFTLLGGTGDGSYRMPLSGGFHYQLQMKAESMAFSEVGKVLGAKKELVGTMDVSFDGGGGKGMKTHFGSGRIQVEDGHFYEVPIVGSLRSFLAGKSNHFGFDEAGDLSATMDLKDGVVHSSDLRIESVATEVLVEGSVDVVSKEVDLKVRANLKGLVGVATDLVSRALEVQGKGPYDRVRWQLIGVPRVLGDAEGVTRGVIRETKGVVGDAVREVGKVERGLLDERPGFLIPKKKEEE